MTATTGKWLLRAPDDGADVAARVLCFPFAGVGASALRTWPTVLNGGAVELCPVQLPGRENRMGEEPYHDFETFAADAAEALRPAMDKPFALWGHCMGALLAYALLVRLEETGGPIPVRLFASSSLVPHRGFFGPFHPDMSDERLGEDLKNISRQMGAGEPLPELLPLAIKVLRNDVQMCFGYKPPGPRTLSCPVSTIGWRDDADVAPDEMAEWKDYADVTAHVLDGDSFTFLKAPPEMFEVIKRDLHAQNQRSQDLRSQDLRSQPTAVNS
jgi:surfactin synthase thioesterase subunit